MGERGGGTRERTGVVGVVGKLARVLSAPDERSSEYGRGAEREGGGEELTLKHC